MLHYTLRFRLVLQKSREAKGHGVWLIVGRSVPPLRRAFLGWRPGSSAVAHKVLYDACPDKQLVRASGIRVRPGDELAPHFRVIRGKRRSVGHAATLIEQRAVDSIWQLRHTLFGAKVIHRSLFRVVAVGVGRADGFFLLITFDCAAIDSCQRIELGSLRGAFSLLTSGIGIYTRLRTSKGRRVAR